MTLTRTAPGFKIAVVDGHRCHSTERRTAWIENFDLDADGTLDYRTTEINGRRVKREFLVGEQWLEVVQQDSRSGVVFNGRFMPVADAIKLSKQSKNDGK